MYVLPGEYVHVLMLFTFLGAPVLENVSFLFLFCNLICCFGALYSTSALAAGYGVSMEYFLLKLDGDGNIVLLLTVDPAEDQKLATLTERPLQSACRAAEFTSSMARVHRHLLPAAGARTTPAVQRRTRVVFH